MMCITDSLGDLDLYDSNCIVPVLVRCMSITIFVSLTYVGVGIRLRLLQANPSHLPTVNMKL